MFIGNDQLRLTLEPAVQIAIAVLSLDQFQSTSRLLK